MHRVHPLPEALMDYVWDYGSLARGDEEMYIRAIMVGVLPGVDNQLITNLVSGSQTCITFLSPLFTTSSTHPNICSRVNVPHFHALPASSYA